MKDKTGAVQRRLVIVPFDAKFTPNDAISAHLLKMSCVNKVQWNI